MALITISYNMGSGGSTIAKRVAQELGVPLFDDANLQAEAVKHGLKDEELAHFQEKAPGFFDRIWSKKPESYLDLMESVVYQVAKGGQGVVVGHGSQMLLRDFGCALHVLVYAPQEARVNTIMESHGLSRRAAEQLIYKNDQERSGFMRFAFHMDWDDTSLYDLVINPYKIGEDLAVQTIVNAARTEQIQACSLTALEAMERMALKKVINAHLLKENIDLTYLAIDVPKTGVASVRGVTRSLESKELVEEVLGKIPEVAEVQSEVHVLPLSGS